jgi:hypothetical protein
MSTPLPAADLLTSPEGGLPQTILWPILSSSSLALLYGPRGIGKSFLALGIAWATANGDSFLKWRAGQQRKVLHVDGELAREDLRERLDALGRPPPGLYLLSAGLHGSRPPDLDRWEPRVDERYPHLLVVDSLSSLAGDGGTTAKRWDATRRWLLRLRELGIATLVVHHATRRGEPRGPGALEDVFDLVMSLRRPPGYQPREGLRVELRFEKARGLSGPAIDPFEARMTTDRQGRAHWEWCSTGSADLHRVVVLLERGLNPNQVARELGLSKSKSYRLREEAMTSGLLRPHSG